MRVLITMPWGQRLGGAEAMLQTVLDGAHESGHELELVFFGAGPWPDELSNAGFRVEVLDTGACATSIAGLSPSCGSYGSCVVASPT